MEFSPDLALLARAVEKGTTVVMLKSDWKLVVAEFQRASLEIRNMRDTIRMYELQAASSSKSVTL